MAIDKVRLYTVAALNYSDALCQCNVPGTAKVCGIDWSGNFMQVMHRSFRQRALRSAFIAERFDKYVHAGSLLDVGCDKAVLRRDFAPGDYFGIDMGGEPDLELNLEAMDRLPFDDGAYTTVLCSDVLEHLDNLHFVFEELVRVAGRYLVLSLPNNWNVLRVPMRRGGGDVTHYGLQSTRPVDRHKWFFNFQHARDFMLARAGMDPALNLIDECATVKPRNIIKRSVGHLMYPSQMRYLNRYSNTYWAVLEKTPAT